MKDHVLDDFVRKLLRVQRRVRELGRSGLQPREAQDLLRVLMTHSPLGMYIAHRGRLQFVNEEFERLTGYGQRELAGLDFSEIVFPPDKNAIKARAWQTLNGKEPSIYEYRILTKDGVVRWVMEAVSPLHEEGAETILGVLADITRHKKAEETLRTRLGQIRKAFEQVICSIASEAQARDPYTTGHQRRVARLACAIAKEMGLSEEQIERLRMAALIHDIGKISVPRGILCKPDRLTRDEFALVKDHPLVASDVLKGTDLPESVIQIVLEHHERLDGSGYPEGLSGGEISLEARILAVADVVEAMASHRSYRPALGLRRALEEISKNRGTLYDPDVVDACLRLFNEKGFKLFEQEQGCDDGGDAEGPT